MDTNKDIPVISSQASATDVYKLTLPHKKCSFKNSSQVPPGMVDEQDVRPKESDLSDADDLPHAPQEKDVVATQTLPHKKNHIAKPSEMAFMNKLPHKDSEIKDGDHQHTLERSADPENNSAPCSEDKDNTDARSISSSSSENERASSLVSTTGCDQCNDTCYTSRSNIMKDFAHPYMLPPYLGQMPLPFPPLANPQNPLLMVPHPYLMLPHQMMHWPFLPLPNGPQKKSDIDFVRFSALNKEDSTQLKDKRETKLTQEEEKQASEEDSPDSSKQDLDKIRCKTEYRSSSMLICDKIKLPHKKLKRTQDLKDISDERINDGKELVPLKLKKKRKRKICQKSVLAVGEKVDKEHRLKVQLGRNRYKKNVSLNTAQERKPQRPRKNKKQLTPEKILYNKLTKVVKEIAEPNIFSPLNLPPDMEIKCSNCNTIYPDRKSLWEHIQCHLRKPVPFRLSKYYRFCKVCEKYVSEIRDHIRAVHFDGGTPYECKMCSDKFRYKGLLRNHIQNRHTTARNYMCEICGLAFKQSVTLRKHKMVHTNKKSFFCSTCDKGFKTMYALQKHVVIHAVVKPYRCEICDKQFTQQTNMKSHMRTHTGEKPYKCDLCPLAFTHNVSLKMHKKKHHGIDMWKNNDSQSVSHH